MTIIERSAAVHWWGAENVPADAAYFVRRYSGGPLVKVTWQEVMERRREKQAEQLERKLSWCGAKRRHAIKVDVRYYDQNLFGGWHAYIYGVRFSHWVRYDGGKRELVERVPLGTQDFYRWCEAFAKAFRRGSFCRRPRGVLFCWAKCSGDRVDEIEWPTAAAGRLVQLELGAALA